MPKQAILFGIILIVYGLGLYAASSEDTKSLTALIPSGFGVVLLLCGLVGRCKDHLRKHVMHVAALVSLIGMGASLYRGIAGLNKILNGYNGSLAQGEKPISELAVWGQIGMGVILGIFLVLCIRSFINARIARSAS